jgi:type II secretion system protein G
VGISDVSVRHLDPPTRLEDVRFPSSPCESSSGVNAMHSVLRPLVRLIALSWVVISAGWIVFDLSAVCVIPRNQSRYVWAQVSVERFGKALERYRADCGGYPGLRHGLKALVIDPGTKGWAGPYTKQPSIDPWGRPYLYGIVNGVPVVRSLGADGKPGGDRFDSDLSSGTRWRRLGKASSTPGSVSSKLTSYRGLCSWRPYSHGVAPALRRDCCVGATLEPMTESLLAQISRAVDPTAR